MNLKQHRLLQLKQRQRLLMQRKLAGVQARRVLNYQPHSKQLAFHKVGANSAERLFMAGNRCGKTLCGAAEVAFHLTGKYPSWWQGRRFDKPVRAWAASVTAETTRDILQQVYLGAEGVPGVLAAADIHRISKRRGVADAVDMVWVRHASGKLSSLGFKSYDQGREKFQGTSRDIIHLDEEPPIRLYEECLLRTLDAGGCVILTMTPLKGMTPLVESFMNTEAGSGKEVVHASWDDATHLSTREKQRLRQSLRPHEVEAREKGVPSLGVGRIYPVTEAFIACERFEIPAHYKRIGAVDFGWTNPTAAVWGAYDAAADTLYIYDCYSVSEQAPAVHAGALQQRGEWIPLVCDPAGQSVGQADGISLIENYAQHGVYFTKAENTLEAGLMQVLERMQSGRLKVFADLEPWWREFRTYRRGENGQVVKRHDHLLDATRYLVTSGLVLATTPPPANPKRRLRSDWVTV